MGEKKSDPQIRDILDRIKRVESVRTDAEMADLLGTTKRTVVSWKQRGSVPWETLTEWASTKGISLDWLIFEKGPMWSDEIGIAEPGAYYRVETNCAPAYRLAGMLHQAMSEAGVSTSPDQFAESVGFLHRDIISSGGEPSYEKVTDLVKLFTLNR